MSVAIASVTCSSLLCPKPVFSKASKIIGFRIYAGRITKLLNGFFGFSTTLKTKSN